jgi:hypothetical protein
MSKQIDIQALVEDWAWEYFRRKTADTRKIRNLLQKEYILMELDWKRVKFVHDPPTFAPEMTKPGTGTPTSNVLFQTSFTNKTTKPQSYSFRTSRTTKSSCQVEIEDCVTQGIEMCCTLKTPCEIFEANVGYSREMELTKTEGQCIEEELTWEVDNSLEVLGRHRAEAKLVILEEEYSGNFEVKTTIKGRVRAVFTNIKDNNSFIKAVEGDINEIVKLARDQGRVKGETMVVDANSKSVICRTKGSCKFKYGLKQDVEVDQFPLD